VAVRSIGILVLVMACTLGSLPVSAQQPPGPPAAAPALAPIDAGLLAQLRKGGFLIFFRHGLTPNYADPGGDPSFDTCSSQRNLSKEGIEQAKAIGEGFRELDIPLGIVRASPYCRCMDTAWHAFGRGERDMGLRLAGSNIDSDKVEARRYRDMRNLAKILPLPGTNSVFVSHGSAGEVFGAGYLDEGEAVIVQPDGAGSWKLIGRVKSTQWRQP
jgi:broad specificity phosphatase PhoE